METQGSPRSSHGIPTIKLLDRPDPHRDGLTSARAVTDVNAPSSKMAGAQMQHEEVRRHLHKLAVWQCQSEDDAMVAPYPGQLSRALPHRRSRDQCGDFRWSG
jgi:hypothetical protein